MSESSESSKVSLTFNLAQKAKSKGGDKYLCETNESFNIYVPQEISRNVQKEPKKTLTVTI